MRVRARKQEVRESGKVRRGKGWIGEPGRWEDWGR